MRSLALLTILLLSSFADAAPRKKKAARPVVSSNQATVVVDAPPSMAKLIQSTMSARYNAVLSKEPLSNAPTAKEVKKVSAPSSAVAVVVGRAEGDSWTITVFSGTDGSPLDTQTFKTKKPLKALPKNVAGSLLLAAATGQAPDDEEQPPNRSRRVRKPTAARRPRFRRPVKSQLRSRTCQPFGPALGFVGLTVH
jgi:hypothetical protein